MHSEAMQLHAFASTKKSLLLEEADGLLPGRTEAHSKDMPRDDLFHGAMAARAQLHLGEIEQTAQITRRVIQGLNGVNSPRVVARLRELNADLASRRSVEDIKDIKELRRELRPLIAV